MHGQVGRVQRVAYGTRVGSNIKMPDMHDIVLDVFVTSATLRLPYMTKSKVQPYIPVIHTRPVRWKERWDDETLKLRS